MTEEQKLYQRILDLKEALDKIANLSPHDPEGDVAEMRHIAKEALRKMSEDNDRQD
jgi:hypothetical protein